METRPAILRVRPDVIQRAVLGGPNYLAPQSTPQSDHVFKYDGTKAIRTHTIRFGAMFNHIQGGGFAAFYSVAPLVSSAPDLLDANCKVVVSAQCPAGPDGTTASNFLNYDVKAITLGNGIGYSTANPAFGFPAGGLGRITALVSTSETTGKCGPGSRSR